jgi:hypothetical protein
VIVLSTVAAERGAPPQPVRQPIEREAAHVRSGQRDLVDPRRCDNHVIDGGNAQWPRAGRRKAAGRRAAGAPPRPGRAQQLSPRCFCRASRLRKNSPPSFRPSEASAAIHRPGADCCGNTGVWIAERRFAASGMTAAVFFGRRLVQDESCGRTVPDRLTEVAVVQSIRGADLRTTHQTR